MDDEQHMEDKLQNVRSYPKLSAAERRERFRARLQRRADALERRLRGQSYQAIGEALGISVSQAYADVQIALAPELGQERERAAALRKIEDERLTMAVEAIEPKVQTGDLAAVGRWIQVSERRARLMGLDLPPQPVAKNEQDQQVTILVRYVDDVEP